MKLGAEERKKLQLLGVVGVGALIACYFLYQDFFGGPTTPPPTSATTTQSSPAPASSTTSAPAAPRIASVGSGLDPTLHMVAMQRTESLVYRGTGRNIFASPGSAPPAVAQAKFPARPTAPAGPAPAIYTGPPPPPPIDLKFFGTATSADGRVKALLLNGDNVFLALPGDVVERRYKVDSIGSNSVNVEDLTTRNTQTLPLLATP